MHSSEQSYRLPPENYTNMNIFNLVRNFISCPSTCSNEVVNLIKEKLNITGRKITFLNKETSNLAGINQDFVDVILNDNSSVTILVSPLIDGNASPFWHRYKIFNNGNIKHILPF